MSLITVDQAKKAEIDRGIAVDAANAWFQRQVEAGFQTQEGWKLGLSESDVTLLTGAFVLAKEAANIGLDLPPIVDTAGVPHYLSLAEMTTLMLLYGQHRASLSAEYAARIAAAG